MKASSKRDRNRAHQSDEEYRVGPGCPPKEYQFKPGQSGNPKGAKRKSPSLIHDLRKVLETVLNQKITVTQGESERIMSVWAAGMSQLSTRLAKGDRHALRDLIWLAEKLGFDLSTPQKAPDETLAQDHQAILDAYVARRTGAVAARSPVELAPPELLDDDTPTKSDKGER